MIVTISSLWNLHKGFRDVFECVASSAEPDPRYDYADGIGGTVAVGLNGSPFNPDYALMRWTDTESDALESVRHIGFTGTSGSYLDYGLNCVLLDTTPNPFTGERGSLDRRAWQSICISFTGCPILVCVPENKGSS